IAVDAGKAVVWVAALGEALDHLLFDRAPHPSCLAQLLGVPPRALPQRACSRFARAVEAARRQCGVGSGVGALSRRLATHSHPGENAPEARRAAPAGAFD
ncbi:MAG: hypothetical protein WCE38_20695, partial [Burkholderiales bacterium]